MIDNKARLFVPLPMNPLHRHLGKDSIQPTTSVTKETTVLPRAHISSSGQGYVSGKTKNIPSQPNSTSDFTIIEIIINPDNQKHESEDFVPAFAQPPMIHWQDSSLESATLMNLRPLRAFTPNTSIASSSALAASPFQSVPSHQVSPQSAFLSSGQQPSPYHQLTYQQSPHDDSDSESSFTSETDNTVTPNTPGSSLLPVPISTLTKLKVLFWVNELRRYLFLWETSRMNNIHAAELHQLLCKIEDKMADPFLTPQMLGETSLGKVMKLFTHGALDARLKEVARHVVGYWRKVCLEA